MHVMDTKEPEPIDVSCALACVKSDALDDWYSIERAKHPHRMGMEPTEYGYSLTWSGRISDADVEGSPAEMRAIADAIERRGEYSAKRCAACVTGESVEFYSPRNSTRPARVPLAVADALARQIRATLGAGT